MSFKQINESFDRLFESFEKEDGPFWYYTMHGLGPGMLPGEVEVVDVYEDDNYNTWVALDKVLDTEELDYYELREEKPPIYESLNEEKIDGKHIIQVSIDAYVENDYDESDLINWTYDVLTRNGYYVYGVDIVESWTNDEYNRKTGLSLADDDKHVILLSFDIEVEDEYYERDIVGCVEQELGLDVLGSDITATWTDEYKYYHNIQESLLTKKYEKLIKEPHEEFNKKLRQLVDYLEDTAIEYAKKAVLLDEKPFGTWFEAVKLCNSEIYGRTPELLTAMPSFLVQFINDYPFDIELTVSNKSILMVVKFKIPGYNSSTWIAFYTDRFKENSIPTKLEISSRDRFNRSIDYASYLQSEYTQVDTKKRYKYDSLSDKENTAKDKISTRGKFSSQIQKFLDLCTMGQMDNQRKQWMLLKNFDNKKYQAVAKQLLNYINGLEDHTLNTYSGYQGFTSDMDFKQYAADLERAINNGEIIDGNSKSRQFLNAIMKDCNHEFNSKCLD